MGNNVQSFGHHTKRSAFLQLEQRRRSISNYQSGLKPNLKASAKKLQMRINPSSSPDDDSKFQINNGIALPKQDGWRGTPSDASQGSIVKWNIHINAPSQSPLRHCRQKHFRNVKCPGTLPQNRAQIARKKQDIFPSYNSRKTSTTEKKSQHRMLRKKPE